jgi:hypothetical protein
MGTIYEETDRRATWTLAALAIAFGVGAIVSQREMLVPAALMAFMALTFSIRIRVDTSELSVRFGVWGIPIFRAAREEVQAIRPFQKRWDGVNWPVRRIRDAEMQSGGGSLPGVLIRSEKGDVWISSREPDELARTVAAHWGIPA